MLYFFRLPLFYLVLGFLVFSLGPNSPAFAQQEPPKPFTALQALAEPGMQPRTMRQLQWCGTANAYAYVLKGTDAASQEHLYIVENGKAIDFGAASILDPELKRFPALHFYNGASFWYTHQNELYSYNWRLKTHSTIATLPESAADLDIHEPSLKVAYTKGRGLYIQDGTKTLQVAYETGPNLVLGKAVHRSEFGITKGTFFSPKGNALAFYRMDEDMVTDYPLVNLIPYPATPNLIKYPMAGQKSHHVTVGVYNLASGQTVYLQTGEPAEQYLTNITWTPDERFIAIAMVNREQDEMKLNLYDAETGALVRTLLKEEHPKYVEPENGPIFLPGASGQFVWQSERDGYNHLYLYTNQGVLLKQLTQGTNPVVDVQAPSEAGNSLLFCQSTNNGLERQWSLLGLNSYTMTAITTQPGVHKASLNALGNQVLDSYSNGETPQAVQLITLPKGKRKAGAALPATPLYTASNPLGEWAVGATRLIELKAADGTLLNGRILYPYNFDSTRKHPVIIYVYGGPHAQMITNSWLYGANLSLHYMAQKGFIVFTLDNRGSAHRGLAFEQATHRQLGNVEMQDQLVGVNWLKQQSWVDASRLGVNGWSFGGFMTTSLMTRSANLFKVGVAGGPVIDWAMYEVMYTERYMGSPADNINGYETASLLNHAKKLKGRLLMIHGTEDDVVVWQHSQLFVKECVSAGIPIDYMIYPGHKHNVVGKDRAHLIDKMTQYFVDFL